MQVAAARQAEQQLTQTQLIEKIDETFRSVVSDDKGIYGVPALTSQGGAVLYYKPDYEELGLEVPKTWDEFIANCDALEAAGKTSMIGTFGDTYRKKMPAFSSNRYCGERAGCAR